MTTRGTAHRTVRIEDGLWEAARVKAQKEGRSISDVIRGRLKEYVEDNQEEQDESDPVGSGVLRVELPQAGT